MRNDFPLSGTQLGMWIDQQRSPESVQRLCPARIDLNTAIEESAWRRAVHMAWETQDGWRMSIHEEDGEVFQRFDPNIEPIAIYKELSGEVDPEKVAETILSEATSRSFPLDDPKFTFFLFRMSSTRSRIALVGHHVFGDGWCYLGFLDKVFQLATAEAPNPDTKLVKHRSYRNFLEKEARYSKSADETRDREFWERTLAHPPAPLMATPPDEFESYRSIRRLNPTQRAQIFKRCRAEGATAFPFFLAVLALFHGRYFDRESFLVTVPVLNRDNRDDLETMGLFLKVLPVPIETRFTGSFWDFVRHLQDRVRECTAHRRFPMHHHTRSGEIGKCLRSLGLSYLPYKGHGSPALEQRHRQGEAAVLTVFQTRGEQDSLMTLETRTDVIEAAQNESMLDQIMDQIVRICDMQDLPADQVPLLAKPTAETAAAAPPAEDRSWGTIEERFSKIVRSQPDHLALEFGMETRTYRELARASHRMASQLAPKIEPEARIGLAMPASIDFITAALAVVRAGGVYVPLDPEYPRERLAQMCALADIRLVLTQDGQPEGVQGLDTEVRRLTELPPPREDFVPPIRPDLSLTNIIFTSGTTGTPKPIALPARGMLRLVDVCRDTGYLSPKMRLGRMGNLSFDLSNFEIWGTLLSGGTISDIPRRLLFQSDLFARALATQRISHMLLPTALFHHVVRESPNCLEPLNGLIVGGEPANPGLFRQAAAAARDTRIYNGYGPAECSVFCTAHLIDPEETSSRIPIGQELPTDDIWIMDRKLRALPDGATGEILIGGPGLARGYLNRPGLTAGRFVPHPFHAGERLYRTGDLGRRLPDGSLDILGRIDNQVKIRGHRIELEDVETMLLKHPDIRETAVLALPDPMGGQFLAAFVVSRNTDKGAIRADLTEYMLPYMIPERLAILERLPHTANGKVDRRALASQVEPAREPDSKDTPATELESQILALWKQRFKLGTVATTANFTEVGGNSLAAMYLAAGVSRLANTKVSVSDIFRHGTVRQLAAAIEARTNSDANRTLTQAERSFLVETINDTAHTNRHPSLFEAFAAMATRIPGAPALANKDRQWTFGQVHRQALALAETLVVAHGIEPDDRVGILADPSVACTTAVLAVLAAGATYVPMSAAFPSARLQHIVEDCGIELILHDPSFAPSVADAVTWRAFPNDELQGDASFSARPRLPLSPATVLYTSGSTGRPKGALLTHAGIMRMVEDRRLVVLSPGDTLLQSGNFVFDVSCFEMFAPLLRGARTYILPKEELLQPELLESVIRRERIASAFFTTAYFNALVDLRPGLFPLLRHVQFGGEMCSPDHIQRALAAIAAAAGETRIVHLYGPTETATLATLFPIEHIAESAETIPVGKPLVNSTAYVLGEALEPLPPGVTGELYLGGDGLALGYLNRPDLTATQFIPNPFQPGGRLYRTGDLAAWSEAGDLVIKGRTDAQVKIRGHRIEPQEIGHHLERHPAVQSAYVLSVQGAAGKELAAFVIAGDQAMNPDPAAFLGERLPTWMIPAKFIYLDRFPLTPNGKVDHRALAEHPELHYEPIPIADPADSYPLSHAQRRLWFLSLSDEGSRAYNMPLTYRIAGDLNPEALRRTWADLRRRHESLRTVFRADNGHPIQQILPDEAFPLPFVAEDLRHKYQPEAEASRRFEREAGTRFDLENGPLWKVLLFRTGDRAWALMLHLHHIISDGWSIEVTMDEQRLLYLHHQEGTPLELSHNRIGYKDFATWERRFDFTDMEHHWMAKLRDHAGPVALPYDRPPGDHHFQGAYLSFSLDKAQTARLRSLAATGRTTLPNAVLALWALALARFSNQTKFNLGYADANRRHPDLTGLLGFFVNMLVLPVDFEDTHDFGHMLARISDSVFEGLEHGLYPFDRLVEKLNPTRDANSVHLINAVFGYQRFGAEDRSHHSILNPQGLFGPSTEVHSMFNQAFDHGTSKFDLTLFAFEHEHQLQFGLEYDSRVFEERTVDLLVHFFTTLSKYTSCQDTSADIDALLRERDRFALEASEPIAIQEDIAARFSRIARRQPRKCALTDGLSHLTYEETDTLSDRFAAWLAPKLGAHRRVVVMVETGPELGWLLLGILKAGATYVPLNPGLLHRHVKRLVEDAGVRVLVTDFAHQHQAEELLWHFPNLQHLFNIEGDGHALVEQPGELGDVTLWDYVGTSAADDIDAGGWQDSYTGKPFSRTVMDEYGDNALDKLRPYLTPDTRVLEIGCASGITMVRVAPLVGRYVGLDLSPRVLAHARARVEDAGWDHVRLACLEAVDVDMLDEEGFDLIVINSVIQCFPGYNYLREVLAKCVHKLGPTGRIFLGDVMDLARKQEMIVSLRAHLAYSPKAKTKIDWSNELFLCHAMLADLAHDLPAIRAIEIGDKRPCDFDNELTRYRFDIFLEVDRESRDQVFPRLKERHDRRSLPLRPDRVAAPANPVALVHHASRRDIAIDQKGILNLVTDQGDLALAQDDRVLLVHQPFEEVHLFELFGSLLNGATAVIAPQDVLANGADLARIWRDRQVTVALLLTPVFHDLVAGNPAAPAPLRKLITGGDRLEPEYVASVREACPALQLVHAWGPSEATVMTTTLTLDRPYHQIPAGKPLAGNEILILDQEGRPTATGIAGEVFVGGASLGPGYLDEEETRDRFVRLPHRPRGHWFRTGDRGRVDVFGNLHILDDTQVGRRHQEAVPEEPSELTASDATLAASILRIWCRELNQAHIEPHHNFFEIGGHSLKAVRVLHRMQEELDLKIPLAVFFNHPTVSGLVRALQSRGDQAEWLMLSEDHPNLPDIYFIPPGMGQPLIFKGLAQRLSGRFNGVGMFYPSSRDAWTLETMTQSIFHGIMKRHRSGPVYLVGYSLGCNLAFQIAKELEIHGHPVNVVLMDGLVLDGRKRFGDDRNYEMEQWLATWNFEDREDLAECLALCFDAISGRTTLGSIAGDLLAIEARDNPVATEMEKWKGFCEGEFRHLKLPGNHFTMLLEDNGNLDHVADLLEERFR
ncbi:Amino acid adenylation domain-containing protein [Sulfidibacter corallicola]|uniref:Amino acid adenylation domain-containing protein n=1 Tax=Sulfidibacter corallicola TaxID=2818388 RepID=A0A8A4TM02_SULCO|nr:non-ribosomal peptide synthetase [Sulfidibacter corallicola]QTD50593.1 amino acid adenylation domain-containing protein [Sulfidibacter corallicola]